MHDDLAQWIKENHPNRIIEYMGKEFTFSWDLAQDEVLEFFEKQGIEQNQYLVGTLSHDFTFEDAKALPSGMLHSLVKDLKKVLSESPTSIGVYFISPPSSTSPAVNSQTGDTLSSDE